MAINLVADIGMNNELVTFNNSICEINSLKFIRNIIEKGDLILTDRCTFEIDPYLFGDRCIVYSEEELDRYYDVLCFNNVDSIKKKFGYSDEDLWVFGEGKLHDKIMPVADKMYLNEIQKMFRRSKAYFPWIDEYQWSKFILEEIVTDDNVIYHKTKYVRKRSRYER